NYVKDENLTMRAFITRCLNRSVLKRLDNTEIIVDALKDNLKLGNTISEALLYIQDEKNREYKLEIEQRLKEAEAKIKSVVSNPILHEGIELTRPERIKGGNAYE